MPCLNKEIAAIVVNSNVRHLGIGQDEVLEGVGWEGVGGDG